MFGTREEREAGYASRLYRLLPELARVALRCAGFSSTSRPLRLMGDEERVLVQYILVRKDLKWPVGAVAAQACHGVWNGSMARPVHPATRSA